MTPGKPYPHNHVPEVTGDDTWDDAEPVTRLEPPARIPSRGALHGAPVARLEPGLRIDGPSRPAAPQEKIRRLEIEEIAPSVVRLKADAPPPRVERIVTFHQRQALPTETHQNRGEGGDWGKKHTISLRWILAMGAIVVTLIVLGMIALPHINAPNAVVFATQSSSDAAHADENPAGIDALNRLLDRQPEAISIYRSFLAATHPDDLTPLIRDAADMNGVLRQRWEPARLPRGWEPAPDSGWQVMELMGHPCALLSGHLPDNSWFQAYFTADNDRLLLDWKATTGYGTATFKDLEQGRGNGDEIRGEITLSDFYSLVFPEDTYQAFQLVSPDGNHYIWCYAARDTPAFAALARELQGGPILDKTSDSAKVTLALDRGPDGSLPNQWLIRDLLQIDWIAR